VSVFLALALGAADAAPSKPSHPFDPPVVRWSEMTRNGSPRAFASLADFAQCVLKRAPEQSAKFLALNYPSKEADSAARKLAGDNSSCTRTIAMMFTTEYFRGALIEAAYHRDGAGLARVRLGSAGTGEMGLPPAVAECVVKSERQLSASLLRTRIAFVEERQAVARLEPAVNQCAAEAKAKQVFPGLLRQQIAEVLYRQSGVNVAGTGK
jgi:hypothetical protein